MSGTFMHSWKSLLQINWSKINFHKFSVFAPNQLEEKYGGTRSCYGILGDTNLVVLNSIMGVQVWVLDQTRKKRKRKEPGTYWRLASKSQ